LGYFALPPLLFFQPPSAFFSPTPSSSLVFPRTAASAQGAQLHAPCPWRPSLPPADAPCHLLPQPSFCHGRPAPPHGVLNFSPTQSFSLFPVRAQGQKLHGRRAAQQPSSSPPWARAPLFPLAKLGLSGPDASPSAPARAERSFPSSASQSPLSSAPLPSIHGTRLGSCCCLERHGRAPCSQLPGLASFSISSAGHSLHRMASPPRSTSAGMQRAPSICTAPAAIVSQHVGVELR
jgi:hypothetical protein